MVIIIITVIIIIIYIYIFSHVWMDYRRTPRISWGVFGGAFRTSRHQWHQLPCGSGISRDERGPMKNAAMDLFQGISWEYHGNIMGIYRI